MGILFRCLQWFILNRGSIDSFTDSFKKMCEYSLCVYKCAVLCGCKIGWNPVSALKEVFSVVWFWHVLQEVVISRKWASFHTCWSLALWSSGYGLGVRSLRVHRRYCPVSSSFPVKDKEVRTVGSSQAGHKEELPSDKACSSLKTRDVCFPGEGSFVSVRTLFECRQEAITSQGGFLLLLWSSVILLQRITFSVPHPNGEK